MEDKQTTDESGADLPPPPPYEMILDRPSFADVPPPPWYEPPPFQGYWVDPAYPEGKGPNEWTADKGQGETGALPPDVQLGFVDFLPQRLANGEFQDFKILMTIVNNWLENNAQFYVINCECIDRPIGKNGQIESYSTIRMKGIFSNTSFVRGVRLWLLPNVERKPVQRIWYMNVLPKPIAKRFVQAHFSGMGGGRHHMQASALAAAAMYDSIEDEKFMVLTGIGQVSMKKSTIYQEFEDLKVTLEKLNEKLKSDPIPGSVLNTSSINMMYAKNFWDPKIFDPFTKPYDPDISMWEVRSNRDLLYLQVLRIFYVESAPEGAEIGIQNFEASCIEEANAQRRRAKYEQHSDVMKKVQLWLQQHPGLRVTNVDTIRCVDTDDTFNPGKTFHVSGSGTEIFRDVLRVAYVTPSKTPFDLKTLQVKAFVPMRWQSRKSEGLSQLVGRINNWLKHSGATVATAETVEFHFEPEARQRIDTESTAMKLVPYSGNYWITGIRLYLSGDYEEPPPDICPPIPVFGQPPGSENQSCSCALL